MAIQLTQEQFNRIYQEYAGKDFGFEAFSSLRELLGYVLHTYDADPQELESRILELYDYNKDITNIALEDQSVQILRVENQWIYIYQTLDFDIFEAMKESWIQMKMHPSRYFIQERK